MPYIEKNELLNGIYSDNPEDVMLYIARFPTADAVERKDIEAECELAYKHGWSNCFAEHRWIPVSERLPEKNGRYLVCGNDKIWICRFMHLDSVHGWNNDAWNPRVEAWIPLPEPYRKETEDAEIR